MMTSQRNILETLTLPSCIVHQFLNKPSSSFASASVFFTQYLLYLTVSAALSLDRYLK